MSINVYLHRLRRWAKPAAKPGKARPARPHLGLENLEDRLVLSTMDIASNGVLTYQADPGEVNQLEISLSGNTYTFTETGGVAIETDKGFFSSVQADASLFDTIQVNLGNKDDTLTVLALGATKELDVAGEEGDDTITIGAPGRGMDDILGSKISVDGGTQSAKGKDKLILDDRDGTPGGPILIPNHFAYYVNGAAVSRQTLNYLDQNLGVESVSSASMEKLDLRASNHRDTISVNSTLADTTVKIEAGDGDDTISTGNMDLLGGTVTVQGEEGTDTLTIDDTSAASKRNYVLTTDTVAQGSAVVTLDSLEGGLTINAPDRVNTFDVQSATALMPLTLNGGTRSDTVTMSDQALTTFQTYQFNAGNLERSVFIPFLPPLPTAHVNYSRIDNLVVNAGSGGDAFLMTDTAQPTLTIDGGGDPTDTIDYSAFTTNVTVNLALGNATKVSALSNVENVIGGAGDDIEVGDAKDNVLEGRGGRDLLIGGEGADVIRGGAGQDLMIDGTTDFDTDPDPTPLATISSTWAGKGKAQDRVNTLKTGGSGVTLSDNGTVHNDAAIDQLFSDDDGPSGAPNTVDWFWADSTQDDFTLLAGDIFK